MQHQHNMDHGQLLGYGYDGDNILDETQSYSSHSAASESLSEALLWLSDRTPARSHVADTAGPWDNLAFWYWELWGEIETDLSRAVSDNRIPSRDLLFDEVEFHSKYYLGGDDLAFLQCISLLEFQAMMFAASLHLNSSQIRNTMYTSTLHCHTSLFETAKSTYHACHDASPVVLTRAAILLSYWSPYSTETYTNSYWVDQAFANARLAHLNEPDPGSSSITPGRRKLIWWSCLIRDRLIALGLRRAQCLHDEMPTGALVCLEDFGLESESPRFMDLPSKWQSIENFIRQCELSQLIAQILRFRRRCGYTQVYSKCENVDSSELLEVNSIYAELEEWRKRFEASLKDTTDKLSAGNCNMPCQLTQIFCDSAIAALYLPYISLDCRKYNSIADKFSEKAFDPVKMATSRIAKSIETLAYKTDSNDIPLALGAWIMFPIAVKLVLIRNSAGLEDPAADLQEMRSLMNALAILKHRFSGVRFICHVLDAVISHVFLAGGGDDHQEIISLIQDAAGIIEKGLAQGIIPASKL